MYIHVLLNGMHPYQHQYWVSVPILGSSTLFMKFADTMTLITAVYVCIT